MKQIFNSGLQIISILLLMPFMMSNFSLAADDDPDQIPEIGNVKWSTDLEVAKQDSKRTGRPVFLLFQEIPG